MNVPREKRQKERNQHDERKENRQRRVNAEHVDGREIADRRHSKRDQIGAGCHGDGAADVFHCYDKALFSLDVGIDTLQSLDDDKHVVHTCNYVGNSYSKDEESWTKLPTLSYSPVF